jgi:hypothetical protein
MSTDFTPSFKTEGSYSPDMLIAGDHPLRTRGIVVLSGQGVLARGTLMGIITSGGKAVKSLSGSSDGSEVPVTILGEDVDASSGDITAFSYVAGDFDQSQMVFGADHTADSTRAALRNLSIYVVKPVSA